MNRADAVLQILEVLTDSNADLQDDQFCDMFNILLRRAFNLPVPLNEFDLLRRFIRWMDINEVYFDTIPMSALDDLVDSFMTDEDQRRKQLILLEKIPSASQG